MSKRANRLGFRHYVDIFLTNDIYDSQALTDLTTGSYSYAGKGLHNRVNMLLKDPYRKKANKSFLELGKEQCNYMRVCHAMYETIKKDGLTPLMYRFGVLTKDTYDKLASDPKSVSTFLRYLKQTKIQCRQSAWAYYIADCIKKSEVIETNGLAHVPDWITRYNNETTRPTLQDLANKLKENKK